MRTCSLRLRGRATVAGSGLLCDALKIITPESTSDCNFHTGLNSLDAIAPHGGFQRGAVHELLWRTRTSPASSFALLLAKAAQPDEGGAIMWNDPKRRLYPPALHTAGIDLQRLMLIRCTNADRAQELWALTECLRCRGVCAVVSAVGELSRVEARRLQLAAERGGGVGLLMRPFAPGKSIHYSAATRWLIEPVPGDEITQRWRVELIHGHGGQVGSSVLLEVNRETNLVCASEKLADSSAPAEAARTSA